MLAKLHRSDLWMIAADEDAVTAYRRSDRRPTRP
jgi:hypothetical protein